MGLGKFVGAMGIWDDILPLGFGLYEMVII